MLAFYDEVSFSFLDCYIKIVSAEDDWQTQFRASISCYTFTRAQVAKLVDAPASGAGVRKDVEVRVFSWAPHI